jgi:hypothetical protein
MMMSYQTTLHVLLGAVVVLVVVAGAGWITVLRIWFEKADLVEEIQDHRETRKRIEERLSHEIDRRTGLQRASARQAATINRLVDGYYKQIRDNQRIQEELLAMRLTLMGTG